MLVYPDYYEQFSCLAGACRHSCCRGWQIDIDPDSVRRYEALEGLWGEKLRASMDRSADPPHFILDEQERCPFWQKDGLCELILQLGEWSLCGICRDHPRFRNERDGRVEMGLGLCCEAAGMLILGRKAPVRFPKAPAGDPVLALRDSALALAQNRSRSMRERTEDLLALAGMELPEKSMAQWARELLELERLEEAWTEHLCCLRDRGDEADMAGFDACMAGRQEEYEQQLCYLLWRHVAPAPDEEEAALRIAFAVFAAQLLRRLGALWWAQTGRFDLADQVELARLFSAEIEYSDENLDRLLDTLAGY